MLQKASRWHRLADAAGSRLVSCSLLAALSVGLSNCGSTCSSNPASPTTGTNCSVSNQTGGTVALHTGNKVLNIAPVSQQTEDWCWLASSEMIFRFYGVPSVNGISYQCGVMGAVAGPASVCFYNCAACPFGAGSTTQAALVLAQYPALVQQYYYPFSRIPQISPLTYQRPLTTTEIEQQIDAGHPVALGITIGAQAQATPGHEVVLVGYSAVDTSHFDVIINDPFPYDVVYGPALNPFRQLGAVVIQPGQYQLAYSTAVPRLQWTVSITTSPY